LSNKYNQKTSARSHCYSFRHILTQSLDLDFLPIKIGMSNTFAFFINVSFNMRDFQKKIYLYINIFACLIFSAYAYAHGPIHESIIRVTKEIKANPDSAQLYLQRGQYYQVDDDFDKAFVDFTKARELAPHLQIIDLQFAKLFAVNNYPASGLIYINQYLTNQPENLNGLMSRAAIYTQLGQDSLAILDFEYAISKAENPVPEFYLDISKAVLAADSTNFYDAIKWLQKGEETIGFNIVLRSHAIDLAVLQGDYNQAFIYIDEILEKMKRKEKWLIKKAEIYEIADRKKEAYATYNDALQSIKQLPRHTRGTRTVTELQAKATLKTIELDKHK